MANELPISWGAVTEFTLTNLNSLADTNIWHSNGVDSEFAAGKTNTIFRIFYKITPVTPADGNSIDFRFSQNSQHATDILPGNVGDTEGEASTAAAKLDIQEALPVIHRHVWRTSQTALLQGWFDIHLPGPGNVKVLIEANGFAVAATGNSVQYAVGVIQGQ